MYTHRKLKLEQIQEQQMLTTDIFPLSLCVGLITGWLAWQTDVIIVLQDVFMSKIDCSLVTDISVQTYLLQLL